MILGVHCSITPHREQPWIEPTVVLLRMGGNLLLCRLFFTELCRAKDSYHHGASLTSSTSQVPIHSTEEFSPGRTVRQLPLCPVGCLPAGNWGWFSKQRDKTGYV